MRNSMLFVIFAGLLAGTLLFIDEGRYSFDFFSETGNLIFFFVFTFCFTSGQFVVQNIMQQYKEVYKIWHSVLLGLPLGMIFYYVLLLLFGLIKKIG